ncbi:MAG: serine/threonine protein kinase [Kofleriaceae bacterium]|nr:serine/threonine protein kinase [Kofleriaceae bacterium]
MIDGVDAVWRRAVVVVLDMTNLARGHTPSGRDPQMFGRYRLLGRLAIGGMAEVWAAQLLATGGFCKPMVIKRVLPELASSPQFLRMLMAEARVAARLSHPNVCAVFELGAVDGEYYLAMEYLRGAPLTELIRGGGAVTAPIAAAILSQVCDGLHYAHEQRDPAGKLLGLVHRDVSPHNLFVTVDGIVKVLDFGIAKVDDGSGDRTEAGKVKGKLPYMSPEQLGGEALDRRSDVWSLGAVLFELLTGRRLFGGNGPGATVDAIRNARVPPLSAMDVSAPGFDELLGRALCLRPQWRFASALELKRAVVEAVQPGAPAGSEELSELVWSRCGARVRANDKLFDIEDPDPNLVDRLPLRADPSSLLFLPDVPTQPTRDVVIYVDDSSWSSAGSSVPSMSAMDGMDTHTDADPGQPTPVQAPLLDDPPGRDDTAVRGDPPARDDTQVGDQPTPVVGTPALTAAAQAAAAPLTLDSPPPLELAAPAAATAVTDTATIDADPELVSLAPRRHGLRWAAVLLLAGAGVAAWLTTRPSSSPPAPPSPSAGSPAPRRRRRARRSRPRTTSRRPTTPRAARRGGAAAAADRRPMPAADLSPTRRRPRHGVARPGVADAASGPGPAQARARAGARRRSAGPILRRASRSRPWRRDGSRSTPGRGRRSTSTASGWGRRRSSTTSWPPVITRSRRWPRTARRGR